MVITKTVTLSAFVLPVLAALATGGTAYHLNSRSNSAGAVPNSAARTATPEPSPVTAEFGEPSPAIEQPGGSLVAEGLSNVSPPSDGVAASSHDLRASASRVRRLAAAIISYQSDHQGHLPADLGATLPYILNRSVTRSEVVKAALIYLSPQDQSSVKLPNELTAEWINQNTSFIYLPPPHTTMRGLSHLYEIVLLHEKPRGGQDGLVATGYGDGHATGVPRAQLEKEISESKRAFEASHE